MKTNELNLALHLELQAWADGQLDQLDLTPARRAEIERLAKDDPAARELIAGLRSMSTVLKANEPAHTVPATRDFYWSQIQRRIEVAERAESRVGPVAPAAGGWLRWLLPAGGLAAVVFGLALARNGKSWGQPEGLADVGSDESGAVVFRSESEGVTICWLD